jgi:hypothetical protein
MRTGKFLTGIVTVALVFALATACWADGRKTAGYPWRAAPRGHGWYKHPYQHARFEHSYRYPYREEVHRFYHVPAPRPAHVPVPAYSVPVYNGNYISGGIAQPGWGFSWSVTLP